MINNRNRTESIAISMNLYMRVEQQQMKEHAEIVRLS